MKQLSQGDNKYKFKIVLFQIDFRGKLFISLQQLIYITNAIVSGVNERPNMIDDGLEPGLDEADLDCGRDAGLEPC